jgi:hypothetical protein
MQNFCKKMSCKTTWKMEKEIETYLLKKGCEDET